MRDKRMLDDEVEQLYYYLSKRITTPNAREGMRKFGKWELILYCDIENFFDIPESTRWGHNFGIVIGHGVRMGERCRIRQGVTLGMKYDHEIGKYPHLGDNVDIGANATLIGGIKIGNNVTIGASTFVNKDIPDNCTVYNRKEIIIKEK
jgi:serine O-acetyltransferase